MSIADDLDAARERLRRSRLPPEPPRDFLTPREVAARVGVSYYSVLRAIRRGDLAAFQVVGRLRIEIAEYRRWAHASPVKTCERAGRDDRWRGKRASKEAAFAAELRELEQEVA
jgi:excisionase family DNA binding protein